MRVSGSVMCAALAVLSLSSWSIAPSSDGALISYYLGGDGGGERAPGEPYHQDPYPVDPQWWADTNWAVEYRLQDGTLIGTDNSEYHDPQNSFSSGSLGSHVAGSVAEWIGPIAGGAAGTWAGSYIGQAVAGGSALAPAAQWGTAASVAGPWVGALVGVIVGAV